VSLSLAPFVEILELPQDAPGADRLVDLSLTRAYSEERTASPRETPQPVLPTPLEPDRAPRSYLLLGRRVCAKRNSACACRATGLVLVWEAAQGGRFMATLVLLVPGPNWR